MGKEMEGKEGKKEARAGKHFQHPASGKKVNANGGTRAQKRDPSLSVGQNLDAKFIIATALFFVWTRVNGTRRGTTRDLFSSKRADY